MNISSANLQRRLDERSAYIGIDNLIRLRRAIAWTKRAEDENKEDHAAKVIFLWIAFNALYGSEPDPESQNRSKERHLFKKLLGQVLAADKSDRFREIIDSELRQLICQLVGNQFLYYGYWKHIEGDRRFANWSTRLDGSSRGVSRNIRHGKTLAVLCVTFDRLYTLRCQVMHGSATWRETDHREQVPQGSRILSTLVPSMIDIILDDVSIDLGRPPYRPINPPLGENSLSAA